MSISLTIKSWLHRRYFRGQFRPLIKRLGLSEIELAHRYGTSPATVRRWLSGEAAPSPGYVEVILRDLRKEVEE